MSTGGSVLLLLQLAASAADLAPPPVDWPKVEHQSQVLANGGAIVTVSGELVVLITGVPLFIETLADGECLHSCPRPTPGLKASFDTGLVAMAVGPALMDGAGLRMRQAELAQGLSVPGWAGLGAWGLHLGALGLMAFVASGKDNGAGLATGVVLYFAGQVLSGVQVQQNRVARKAHPLTVVPMASPQAPGVVLGGSF